MNKVLLAVALLLLLGTYSYAQEANEPVVGLSVEGEADVILSKDYQLSIFDENVDIELKSQAYMVGCPVKLGSNLGLTPKIGVWDSETGNDDIRTENSMGLVLGLDGKYRLVEVSPATLSLIGSYRFADSEIDKVNFYGVDFDMPLKTDINLHSYELGIRSDFAIPQLKATPYVAAVYSDSIGNASVDASFVDLKADLRAKDHFGMRCGIQGEPIKDLTLKLEGKFIDQEAIVASASYKF
jgi:hypothetical protein